ncbi:MAG: ABC transporter ATP-binding protein, partial [Kiritimatiellae bacterium]|nr:ABC transporter ATP-binding protein [Kiritimatiellia bacterium]
VAARAKEEAPAPEARAERPAPQPSGAQTKRLSYNERREYEALPSQIEALEAEEAELGTRLSDPEVYRQPAADLLAWQARLDAIPAEVERLMARWAELDERA